MNAKTLTYWICTGLIAAMTLLSAFMALTSRPEAVAGTARLGYPPYFMYILGTWYVLGVLALLAPGRPVLKEWAYAGFMFTYTSAVVSHLASGDGPQAAAPLVALLILAGSYFLRPTSRRIATTAVAA